MERAYATAGRPDAPPHPISTMLNVNVDMTKLFCISIVAS
jgi:hypothetical protein